jgi:hypothetical protein
MMDAKSFYKYCYSYCRQKRMLGYKIETMVQGAGVLHALSSTRDHMILYQAALSLQMSEAVDPLAIKEWARRYGFASYWHWRS